MGEGLGEGLYPPYGGEAGGKGFTRPMGERLEGL